MEDGAQRGQWAQITRVATALALALMISDIIVQCNDGAAVGDPVGSDRPLCTVSVTKP